ncbi:MAG: hypothetical protein OXC46_04515 [Thaumarchaeota archaeon]|nr:hypothetical protein [Nitrososphaerota archaeon]
MRLVLFPALVVVFVLIFAVGLNESYAEIESVYRDDGTLKETIEYYEENNQSYKLVTEYRKDGSVKIEAYYVQSDEVGNDFRRSGTIEYRDDGTLLKYSAYTQYNDVVWKSKTIKFNSDGFPIWKKFLDPDGPANLVEYKYYKDGKLKKMISSNEAVREYKYYENGKLVDASKFDPLGIREVVEYKYYKDGKLKKTINTVDSGKNVIEYNKKIDCIEPFGRLYLCYAGRHMDYDWFERTGYYDGHISHLLDTITFPDYDYGSNPIKETWYGNNGFTLIRTEYWDNGEQKIGTEQTRRHLINTTYDKSGNMLTSTTYGVKDSTSIRKEYTNGQITSTSSGTWVVNSITEVNPDGSMLKTGYKWIFPYSSNYNHDRVMMNTDDNGYSVSTDWIQYISEIGSDHKTNKTTWLHEDGSVWMWEDYTRKNHYTLYDSNGDVMSIYYTGNHRHYDRVTSFNPHCPPDRVSDYNRKNMSYCMPEPVQECSTDGVTEQDESGRITKTTWRNANCDLLEYEDRAYWSNGNISQIIKYDADDNMLQFTYYDDDGNIHASHEYEDGEKIKSTFYRTDGSIYRVTEYDDDGNIFKITEYREDGSTYEVDPDN